MVSPAKTSSHPHFNKIFEKLVIETNPDEPRERLIGMLAYADYKEEKYQWKEQYRQIHQVDEIPELEVRNFLLAYHPTKLDKLRADAEYVLLVFAESYTEARENEAYERGKIDSMLDNFDGIKEVIKNNEKNRDGWWKTGIKGAFGSFLFATMALVITAFFSIANPDTNYSKLFQYIIGNKDFIVLSTSDPRLSNNSNNVR